MKAQKYIEIKGAKLHNLKNIDISIPKNKLVVFTGVSGSGKSSLVFDTIYAEGQRRYVESLSSYARQFMGKLNKPEVDYINGLSPSIAIEQKVNTKNPRSTVATSTEIYDYLKLLFARIGHTISPFTGKEVKCHDISDVISLFESLQNDSAFYILVPLDKKQFTHPHLQILLQKGFSRILIDDHIEKTESLLEIDLKKSKPKNIFILIDRLLKSSEDDEQINRATDSIQSAFYEGEGEIAVMIKSEEVQNLYYFNNKFEENGIKFERPSVNLLSFNNPYGACKTCEGFGIVLGIDEDLVIPDKSISLYDGCVMPWRSETFEVWKTKFIHFVKDKSFPIHRPFYELSAEEKELLWGYNHDYGITAFFNLITEQSYKIQYRVLLSKYKGKTTCHECKGVRIRKDANYIKLLPINKIPTGVSLTSKQISISDILLLPIHEAFLFFQHLELSENESKIAHRIIQEIKNRLRFMVEVGLGYLNLNRLSSSLSGGESQRINLATSLGSALVGSTYILDEPSIGLHSKDTERLIGVLIQLKNMGNTVLVVEHDEDVMLHADEIVDIGPLAGVHGGEVVFQGNFDALYKSNSLTGKYLTHKEQIAVPQHRRAWNQYIEIKGARQHNLKNITVKFPLEVITVVTGVSGSGKTTLVKGILYPALQKNLGFYTTIKTGIFDELKGNWSKIKSVELIDQNPIGKSSRSNPVTYVKAYDAIRDLFADQHMSKQKGYKSGDFSFNVDGGRCDNCKGEGEEIVEMQFMADLHLTCEVCKGKRFKEDILEIKVNGKNIYDILNLTIDEALIFFENHNGIKQKIMPLQDVGLGYVKLGQSSNTLSGGEAQRVKLASFLGIGKTSNSILFIFDEPTTGLHFHDVQKLLNSFNALVKLGHTVIIIEHNLDIIKCGDWVIDIGPEGGDNGGQIIFEGTPENLIKIENSETGKYLLPKLK